MIFKWTILDKQSGNIRFIKFRDSSYALDPVLEEIEAKGQQGSKVLLEGTSFLIENKTSVNVSTNQHISFKKQNWNYEYCDSIVDPIVLSMNWGEGTEKTKYKPNTFISTK